VQRRVERGPPVGISFDGKLPLPGLPAMAREYPLARLHNRTREKTLQTLLTHDDDDGMTMPSTMGSSGLIRGLDLDYFSLNIATRSIYKGRHQSISDIFIFMRGSGLPALLERIIARPDPALLRHLFASPPLGKTVIKCRSANGFQVCF
jgi:hypothetical protein